MQVHQYAHSTLTIRGHPLLQQLKDANPTGIERACVPLHHSVRNVGMESRHTLGDTSDGVENCVACTLVGHFQQRRKGSLRVRNETQCDNCLLHTLHFTRREGTMVHRGKHVPNRLDDGERFLLRQSGISQCCAVRTQLYVTTPHPESTFSMKSWL